MRTLAFAATLLVACGSHDREHGSAPVTTDTPPPASKENRVFDVKSSDDLEALGTEYMKLCTAGFDGTLEVHVAAGSYAPTGWSLFPEQPTQVCNIDVVMKGAGAALPFFERVRARSLRLEGIAFTGSVPGGVEVHVATDFTMVKSAIIDARLSDSAWPTGFFQIFAEAGAHQPTNVTIEDSWFVRNYQAAALNNGLVSLQVMGPDGGFFDQVAVRRCAFLGNAFMYDVDVDYGKNVSVEDSMFFRNWYAGTEVHCDQCKDVVVKRSRFAVEQVSQVAAAENGSPAQLSDSRAMVKGWQAGAAIPATMHAEGQVADRAKFAAGEDVVPAAITKLTTPPLAVPGADVWASLDAAFGK